MHGPARLLEVVLVLISDVIIGSSSPSPAPQRLRHLLLQRSVSHDQNIAMDFGYAIFSEEHFS